MYYYSPDEKEQQNSFFEELLKEKKINIDFKTWYKYLNNWIRIRKPKKITQLFKFNSVETRVTTISALVSLIIIIALAFLYELFTYKTYNNGDFSRVVAASSIDAGFSTEARYARRYTHIGNVGGMYCKFDLSIDREGQISGSYWQESYENTIYELTGYQEVLPDGRYEMKVKVYSDNVINAEITLLGNPYRTEYSGSMNSKSGKKTAVMISKK